MRHFMDIVPEDRWKNDLLDQLAQINQNLNLLIELQEGPKKGVKKGAKSE